MRLRFRLILFVVLVNNSWELCEKKRGTDTLVRRKRYLAFPKSSTWVVTLSLLKAIQVVQPRVWNLCVEADVPFDLPENTHRKRIIRSEQESIFRRIKDALSLTHLYPGNCLGKLACKILSKKSILGKSLIIDLFHEILRYEDIEEKEVCTEQDNCKIFNFEG